MRTRIPSSLFIDSVVRKPASSEKLTRLYVLMHGYEQSGQKIYDKLESLIPSKALVLSPNGPFPLPRAKSDRDGYELGFSWYFYDSRTDEYFIDMEIGSKAIGSLITELNRELKLEGVPTTLVGFSQGGYIAPFAASLLPQVDQVIGIGCQFLHEELKLPISFRMDQIHGSEDDTVMPSEALKSHQALQAQGVKGEFHMLEGTGHRIDAAVRAKFLEILL